MAGRRLVAIIGGLVIMLGLALGAWMRFGPSARSSPWLRAVGPSIALPEPERQGGLGLHAALQARRSVREYSQEPLTLEEVAQLLWAAQGVNDASGYRTAPSAGALYPLELYLVLGDATGLRAGVYHYDPQEHALTPLIAGDVRPELAGASLGQSCVAEGAATLVFAAEYARTTGRYGQRGEQYVHMEVGHAAQNVYLQAASLGLGTVVVGAFEPEGVSALLELPEAFVPLYLMPVGRPVADMP
jgi:SagB-type dehydrogenase family enzyme